MRKVYAKFAEDSSGLPSVTTISIASSPSQQSLTPSNPIQSNQVSSSSNGESECSDPFYDRFPWFRLIGRGLVFLQNLLVPCSVTQCICIVNEKGDVMGYLRVSVEPVNDGMLLFVVI